MNKLYDALEICLQEIENGADLESVLLRFPELADELHPILEASIQARTLAAPEPGAEVVRRGRAKILQHAAEVREELAKPAISFPVFAPLRRIASMVVVVALIFASGTSLVGAASTSLPGENLYTVKRSWENMQLLFTFNSETRDALEIEHENERLEELKDLFASGRSEKVSFNGVVTRQSSKFWLVAGIPVVISAQSDLPDDTISVNAAVRVVGETQPDGSVVATSIELLPIGSGLPDVDDDGSEGTGIPDEAGSNSGSGNEAPEVISTQQPEREVQFSGELDVFNEGFWTINGVNADVSTAEVEGTPAVGAAVIVEGYFNEAGVFIVTKLKFVESNSNREGESSSNENDNQNNNVNDNGNDNDGGNSNDNDNNDNDNGNSGSGGGGDD